MTNPIDDIMRDFGIKIPKAVDIIADANRAYAVDQLEKEVRGEHTDLDDIPDEEFMIGEALFYAKMANKGLNVKSNRKLAVSMIKVAKKILEKKK